MKHLYLVRHAKSSWAEEHLNDRDRPLNHRGQAQLTPLAQALDRSGALGGTLYASDANRARSTLEGILPPAFPDNRVQLNPELYTFDYRRLLAWLKTLNDNQDTVTLIGHNPALLELAGYLLKHAPAQLPTAGFLCIALPDQPWHSLAKGQGKLDAFLTPAEYSYRDFARKHKKKAATRGTDPAWAIPAALQHQLKRMRQLEPGVITGLDDEFLHQFRIAIRRSRAIAESLQEVTGDKSLAKAIKQLKKHAKATSRLRDLHVFLQDLPVLCGRNEELRTTLETWALNEAAREHQALTDKLESKHYRDAMHDWDDLIHAGVIKKLARRMNPGDIRKAVDKRVQTFNRCTAEVLHDSPDTDIHSLRKQLKRIRYLMELDTPGWKHILKSLKYRQELYGRFQDLHVQMGLISELQQQAPDTMPAATRSLLSRLNREKAENRRLILALGGLNLAQGD